MVGRVEHILHGERLFEQALLRRIATECSRFILLAAASDVPQRFVERLALFFQGAWQSEFIAQVRSLADSQDLQRKTLEEETVFLENEKCRF